MSAQPQKSQTAPQLTPDLVEGLSQALNDELTTILRYLLQSALVRGAQWSAVREMYAAEATGEMAHAKYLADKLAVYGVTPQFSPRLPDPPSDPAAMLRFDIAEELAAVAHYKHLAELADQAGLIELKVALENNAADEELHAERLSVLLGEPLSA